MAFAKAVTKLFVAFKNGYFLENASKYGNNYLMFWELVSISVI